MFRHEIMRLQLKIPGVGFSDKASTQRGLRKGARGAKGSGHKGAKGSSLANYGTDRKLNPALIRVRRTEAPGAGAEEVPECA